MRHIKQLLVLFLVFNVFASCEEEEVSYALQDISAPTDVKAVFDISQDEIGLVTLTPSATGASEFHVYFGDVANETPTKINPGETINYNYAEGEYSLRIIAVGLTGLTSELVRIVTVSFDAPEDLKLNIAISDTNPFEVQVSPSATNATVFDLYFGDVEDEEATTIMASVTANHVYAEVGDYTIRVVARGAGAATLEMSEELSITGAVKAMSLPLTFDDALVNYTYVGFNGASFEVVDNPDVSGANDAVSKVGAITNSGAQYEGGTFELAPPLDFSGDNKTITMKFWSEVSLPVLLKFEGGVNDERQNEVSATHGGTGWEVLTFNFATDAVKSYIDGEQGVGQPFVPTGQYASMVLFIDGPGTTAGTFYIDDVEHIGGNGDGGGGTTGEISDDFDANRNIGTWYGDASGMDDAFPNPHKEGINTSNTVLKYTDDGGQYANVGFDVVSNFDLTVDNTFTLKIYVPSSSITGSQPNQISLKLQDGTADKPWEQQTEIIKPIELDQWQTVTFDFANDVTEGAADPLTRTDFNRVVLQVNGEGNPDEVIAYIDDFFYGTSDGGTTDGGNGTSDPTAAAPTPTAAAENVKSIFSDAYTDPAGVNYFPGWGQSTAYEIVSISGNDAIKYSNLNYQGIEIGENVDGTAYESVRIDVWSGDYTSLSFFLISSSGEESVTLNLTPNQWNSIDISLSAFTDQGLSISDLIQFKFDVQPDDGGSIFIDNLYFYTSGSDGGTNGGDNGGNGGGATGDVAENGNFETGNLDGWAVYKNGGIIEADNTQSNGGDWSAKIIASSPDGLNPTLKQERKGAGTVAVGDIVQIKFDYKGSAAAGGIYSLQSFVEAADGVNQTEVFSVTPTATWQTFSKTYTVNAGDVSGGITMEFTAICGGDAACSSTLNLDNVSVILNP